MKMYRKNRLAGWKRQKGMTLMELLVAGVISIVVSSGMIILMASTLGTGTQTIKMTKLSSEMRTGMQIMTRELRRANYHASFISCYGDPECLDTLDIADEIKEIGIDGDCFWFWYDRPQRVGETTVDVANETVAGFRRVEVGGIGIIQMTTSGTSAPSCTTGSSWVNITNTDIIDITAFNVDDSESYTYTVNGTQSIGRIGITMSGRLRSDDASLPAWMQGNNAPLLTVQDFVRVRNDVFSLSP